MLSLTFAVFKVCFFCMMVKHSSRKNKPCDTSLLKEGTLSGCSVDFTLVSCDQLGRKSFQVLFSEEAPYTWNLLRDYCSELSWGHMNTGNKAVYKGQSPRSSL